MKHFLCKHKDQNLNPNIYVKAGWMWRSIYNPSREAETGNPCISWLVRLMESVSSGLKTPNVNFISAFTGIRTYAPTPIQEYIHIRISQRNHLGQCGTCYALWFQQTHSYCQKLTHALSIPTLLSLGLGTSSGPSHKAGVS